MEFAEQRRCDAAQRQVGVQGRVHQPAVLFGYLVSAILLLIGIYLDAMAPDTALGDVASMSVFP